MTARTTAGIETWSTNLVEPGRRLDYWIGAVCECFLEMDIKTPVRAGFDCSIQRGQLDTTYQPCAGLGAARLPQAGQRRARDVELLLPALQARQRVDGHAERPLCAHAAARSSAAGFTALL